MRTIKINDGQNIDFPNNDAQAHWRLLSASSCKLHDWCASKRAVQTSREPLKHCLHFYKTNGEVEGVCAALKSSNTKVRHSLKGAVSAVKSNRPYIYAISIFKQCSSSRERKT